MFEKLKLDYEPIDVVKKLSDGKSVKYSEMTDFQQAFLCGAIKEKRPKKVLEVGISAGGTTAVILECLREIGNECKMYSVDWLDYYYLEPEKPVGFLARDNMDKVRGKTQHKFLTGNSIPYFIEEIGTDVDCLILDTYHSLPGELMDFIICLPFLKNGCVVILHDVGENMLNHNEGHEEDIATKLLFTAVSGKKYYMPEEDTHLNEYMISNIAAFVIDETTRENVDNLIMALSSTWKMVLSRKEINQYCEQVKKYYDSGIYRFFNRVVGAQERLSVVKEVNRHCGDGIDKLVAQWKECEDGIYLYGAGHFADVYIRFAHISGLKIKGLIVSDGKEFPENQEMYPPIIHLSESDSNLTYNIVLALDKCHWEEILNNLKTRKNFNVFGAQTTA